MEPTVEEKRIARQLYYEFTYGKGHPNYLGRGSTKNVIGNADLLPNWVVKFDIHKVIYQIGEYSYKNICRNTYCFEEANIYNIACEKLLSNDFAETYVLGFMDGRILTMQRRADTGKKCKDLIADSYLEDLIESEIADYDEIMRLYDHRDLEGLIYDYNCGEDNWEFIERFFDEDTYYFLYDLGVLDCHLGNIGLINGTIKLIDFSSY